MSAGNNGDGDIKFTPYASPLRMFKSYRYHPSYAHDVAGGFLSLTFSHQIDPQKPLCQYESAGGTCNDAACPDQHFQDLNITGASKHQPWHPLLLPVPCTELTRLHCR